MMRVFRGIVDSVVEGAIKRLSGKGIAGETISNREFFQHYGLTSRPLEGAEYVGLKDGNTIYIVASDDRRYRIALEDGEAALYDDQGQAIHLKRDKEIAVYGCDKATVDAAVEATITAPLAKVVAETKVELTTPLVACSQDLSVGGNMTVSGTGVVTGALSSKTSVADPNGTMQAMRNVYDNHTQVVSGSTAAAPTSKM